ncbi:MAG TPA: hypothetical protein PKX07_15375, partial [Aggregatilineales bacterium]|nr:hypothetical protein [Aggregatilineales bacterium]
MLDALPENSRSVTPPQARPRRLALTRSHLLVGVLLLAVLLFGGFLRFYGTNWDDYVHFHPDERFMAGQVALSLGQGWLSFTDGGEEAQRAHCMAAYPESGGIGPFFDARCSTWNPHNIGAGHMAYGTFPFFVTRWTVDLLESAFPGSSFGSYDGLPLVWRTLSAGYDTLTILLVFFIGLTLRSRWLGLLAALLYAAAVLPIQIAHFATADAMTAMWAAFTVLFSVRGQKHGGVLNFALAGIGLGAA